MSDQRRPIYTVRLRAEPDVDAIKALRAFLKTALRRLGLRALSVDTEVEDGFDIYAELQAEYEAKQRRRRDYR
jgi:hypothetical protein